MSLPGSLFFTTSDSDLTAKSRHVADSDLAPMVQDEAQVKCMRVRQEAIRRAFFGGDTCRTGSFLPMSRFESFGDFSLAIA